ncbi:MAG: DUF11 domain-containing protein, partial [Chloroflexi bacterium]|nr:DUF11 domain-containing protein [Chloroflexota bacterium]
GGNGGFGGGAGARGSGSGSHGAAGSYGGVAGTNIGLPTGGGGAGLGGAIFNDNGRLTVRNSTFAANAANSGNGGGGTASSGIGFGGAIFSLRGSTDVRHSTFSGNTASGSSGPNAGGIYVAAVGGDANLTLRNTIVHGNSATSGECVTFAEDDRTVNAGGAGNLVGKNAGCPGVVATADPLLGPLQVNAPGNTPTMAIGLVSPAYDAADDGSCLDADQRGVTRPQGDACDIGAFEALVADLSISKTCHARDIAGRIDEDVIYAGQQWICDIVVRNPSSVPLSDFSVIDSVPAGARFVAHTAQGDANGGGNPAVCAPLPKNGPADVTCTGLDVDRYSSVRFQLAFVVDPSFVAAAPTGELPISNTACLAEIGGVIDPNPNNNCATDTDLVKDLADLRISKYVEPVGSVRAGDTFTYTIFVDNLGPSTARNVTITDTLLSSANVSIQSCAFSVSQGGGSITQFTCTTGNLVSTQFGTDVGTMRTNKLEPLTPTSQGRLRASFRLVAKQNMKVTNTVRVSSLTPDPDMSNNFTDLNIDVTAVADLQTFATFGAEVQTNGLPGKIIDTNALLAMPDPACCNFGGTTVTAGRRIQWDASTTNNGPSRAENVRIEVLLPFGTSLIESSLTAVQNVGQVPGRCYTEAAGELRSKVICEYGTLQPGKTGSLRFLLLVDPSLAAGTQLSIDTRSSSESFDPNTANNIAGIQFDVNTWADMSISKTSVGQRIIGYDAVNGRFIYQDTPGQVTAGLILRYEIAVQNNGPSDSQNVTVKDTLPAQGLVTLLSADGADCRPDAVNQNILYCSLGTMAAGERRSFDLYVRVDPAVAQGTNLTNTAEVLQAPASPPAQPPALPPGVPQLPLTADPFLANNTATAQTLVTAVSDVGGPGGPSPTDNSIVKVDLPGRPDLDMPVEPDRAIAGTEHRYLIRFGTVGPSNAVGVTVIDQLDFKQAGIPGERFLRCESYDGVSTVSCSYNAVTNRVQLQSYTDPDGSAFIAGQGVLVPGKPYAFYLVVEVDSGYVLDADDFIARDTVTAATTTNDPNPVNNADSEDTRIIAEADLSIAKTDIFGTDPDNGFLMCDPVVPGGMIQYTLTVNNAGPSDAADVYVVDQLPAEFVAVDPAQVQVTVSAGEVVEVRDDGRITIRLGEDRNNQGAPELGRINESGAETVEVGVMVRRSAPCGQEAENHAYVETRRNDADWPPDASAPPAGGPRTPTFDPATANNAAVETTRIECPSIRVNKTVSYDGTCPGADVTTINDTGQPVTFCFEITNTGTTYLDTIVVTDTLTSKTQMMTVVFSDTITSGADPKVPVAPGETVKRQVTVPHFSKECGRVTDTVQVSANPVNSGRTDYPCLPLVAHADTAVIEVPCAGLDWRLQLPILGPGDCESWIQIQNVGNAPTMAMLVAWGEPGFCPPQAAGPLKVECSGLLRQGSAWTMLPPQIPNGANSGVVYSLSADEVLSPRGGMMEFGRIICNEAFFQIVGDDFAWAEFDSAYRQRRVWRGFDFGAHPGEPLVVSVNRSCPDAGDPNARSNAAYSAISSDMEGAYDPESGGYAYYAPLIFASNAGLNTSLHIQNSGSLCTSLEVWLKGQDNCLRPIIGDILTLSPGETISFDPNTVVGPDWLGSAWIRSTQPLGIVVDAMGTNHFTSYNGTTADIDALHFSYGNQVNFAPLIYSEYQGWDTAIQVQNLSPVINAKVKVYFLDRSGDVITTLVDWICPRGSQTFFLPTIAALGGNWVGSARIESQDWWAPGTNPLDHPRIASVVLLEKWSDPARTTRREAVAYNGQTECLLYDWQVGAGKGGTQSGSAVFAVPLLSKGNRGINSELAITNLVAKPGFTDFAIFIYDQNGLLDFVCQKLNDRQVEYIDLATWGYVPPNFLGSAVVSATFWEHDVFDPSGNFVRNLVGLGGVVVERIGARQGEPDIPGDESKAFEAVPVFDHFGPESRLGAAPRCPGQPGFNP